MRVISETAPVRARAREAARARLTASRTAFAFVVDRTVADAVTAAVRVAVGRWTDVADPEPVPIRVVTLVPHVEVTVAATLADTVADVVHRPRAEAVVRACAEPRQGGAPVTREAEERIRRVAVVVIDAVRVVRVVGEPYPVPE
jgi:hypothetical protein